jgi:hypothetical protein
MNGLWFHAGSRRRLIIAAPLLPLGSADTWIAVIGADTSSSPQSTCVRPTAGSTTPTGWSSTTADTTCSSSTTRTARATGASTGDPPERGLL